MTDLQLLQNQLEIINAGVTRLQNKLNDNSSKEVREELIDFIECAEILEKRIKNF